MWSHKLIQRDQAVRFGPHLQHFLILLDQKLYMQCARPKVRLLSYGTNSAIFPPFSLYLFLHPNQELTGLNGFMKHLWAATKILLTL